MALTEIIENLKNTFKEHNLNLTSTIMPTEKRKNILPFLIVEHILTKENGKKNSTLEILPKLQQQFLLF